MANAYLNQFRKSYEKEVCDIFGNVSVGTTGAPTLNTSALASSKGIKSIARNSAGNYTITLQQPWVKLLNVDATITNTTGIASAPSIGILTTGTNVASVSAPTVQIVFSTGGTATDLASGSTILLQITVGNTTAY